MRKTRWGTAVRFALLLVISLIWAIPLIWCVWSAIRPASMVTKFNFELTFSAENFRYVFELWDFFTYLKNSLIITLGTLAVQLFTVTLAAYAIARLEFAGKKLVMTILMAHMVIPGSVLLLSNYLTIKEMGLLDRRLGVMVIYFGSSMGIMLLRQCYKTIPKALEEAAVIDGCNLAQSLLHVYLPSCKTAYCFFEEALAVMLNNMHRGDEPRIYAGLTSVFDRDVNRAWNLSDERVYDLIWQTGDTASIFGLDFPYNDARAIREAIDHLTGLDLPEESKRRILGGNLTRALNL